MISVKERSPWVGIVQEDFIREADLDMGPEESLVGWAASIRGTHQLGIPCGNGHRAPVMSATGAAP